MEIPDIHEAGIRPSNRVEGAPEGEELMIEGADELVIPIDPGDGPRRGGRWRGKVLIAEDFDELPEEIAHAFGMHLR